MPLTEISLLDDYNTHFYGRELYFEREGFNNLNLYSLILSDLAPYWSVPGRGGAFVMWNMLVNILSFDNNVIQSYSGLPKRYRFGSYSMQNADCNYEHNYIYFERQTTRYGKTWVVPGDSPETLIFPPSLAPLTANYLERMNGRDTSPDTPIATAINVELNPTVIADIYLVYTGRFWNTDTYGYYNEYIFVNI